MIRTMTPGTQIETIARKGTRYILLNVTLDMRVTKTCALSGEYLFTTSPSRVSNQNYVRYTV